MISAQTLRSRVTSAACVWIVFLQITLALPAMVLGQIVAEDEPTTERPVESIEPTEDGETSSNPQPFRDVVFSEDGKLMATTSGLQSSRREYSVWEVGTWTKRCSYTSRQSARTLHFSPDGKRLFIGVERGPENAPDKGKLVWIDTTTGKPTRVDFAGAAKVFFSPDATLLAATDSKDFSIVVWDVAKNAIKTTLQGHTGAVQTVAFTADNRIAVSGANKNGIIIWDVVESKPKHKNYIWGTVAGVAISKDGKRAAATSSGDLIRTYSTTSGRRIVKVGGPSNGPGMGHPERVDFSPDGKLLAYSGDGTAICITRLDKPAPQADAAQIAAFIAQLDDDRFVVRERATASLIKMGDVASDALSKAEKNNPTFEAQRRIKYITSRITAPEPDRVLVGHTQRIDGLKFTPDGRFLVSGSHDNTLRIWEVKTGKQVASLVSTGESPDSEDF
jgi:WD40 repeat protein